MKNDRQNDRQNDDTHHPDSGSGSGDHARYADWDAAYVLGALSTPERAEYERHLDGCPRCGEAVAGLAGMPGLLGRVDADDAEALLDDPATTLAAADQIAPHTGGRKDQDNPNNPDAFVPPLDLLARIERAEARGRRTQRIRTWGIAAAAAVIAAVTALVVPAVTADSERPTVVAELAGAPATPLEADVRLYDEPWGTRVEMSCIYTDAHWTGPSDTTWNYGLYVVGVDGTAAPVSTWTARVGASVHTSGSTDLTVADINTVQVRSMDSGSVLLWADVP